MYVQRHFSPVAKDATLEMISYVRRAFTKILKELVNTQTFHFQSQFFATDLQDWMDEKTKRKAKEKLDKMGQYIAYPEEVLEQTVIDNFFQGLEVEDDDAYGNALRLMQWRRR